MTVRIDLELTIKDLDQTDAVELWKRLTLVAEGFLRDGREVELSTYRFTDDDGDVEVLTGPPDQETRR